MESFIRAIKGGERWVRMRGVDGSGSGGGGG